MNYRYFARVNSSHPSVDEPSIVCRQWTDEEGRAHEEQYTQDLRWQAGNTVHLVRSGELEGEIHPITEEAARRFEELQAARVRSHEPADGRYFYSLVVTNLHPVESPRALLRTWLSPQGYSMEQAWTPTGGWMFSNYTYELSYDHLDGDAVGIAEEEVERYKEIAHQNYLKATRVIDYRYYAIVDEGHPVNDPLMFVRQWDEDGEVKEEQLVVDLRWQPSDLLRQHGDRAVRVDEHAARAFEFTLVKRYRQKHGL